MSDAPQQTDPALSLECERHIDQVCDEFERAWKSGQQPRIEDFLAKAPQSARTSQLRELAALD